MEKYSYFCNKVWITELMIKFIGEYSVKLDDKGRVIFPSAFKIMMSAEADMRFVIKKDIFEDCLEMFTYSEWEKQSEQIKSRLDLFKKDHARFWREYMRNSAIVEPDSKIGRMSIPKKLLEIIGAEKNIIFYGNDHKIEIWAKDKFEDSVVNNEEFLSIAESIPNFI